jgi:hypothetical protein
MNKRTRLLKSANFSTNSLQKYNNSPLLTSQKNSDLSKSVSSIKLPKSRIFTKKKKKKLKFQKKRQDSSLTFINNNSSDSISNKNIDKKTSSGACSEKIKEEKTDRNSDFTVNNIISSLNDFHIRTLQSDKNIKQRSEFKQTVIFSVQNRLKKLSNCEVPKNNSTNLNSRVSSINNKKEINDNDYLRTPSPTKIQNKLPVLNQVYFQNPLSYMCEDDLQTLRECEEGYVIIFILFGFLFYNCL